MKHSYSLLAVALCVATCTTNVQLANAAPKRAATQKTAPAKSAKAAEPLEPQAALDTNLEAPLSPTSNQAEKVSVIKAIHFSGLQSINESELLNSLPLKVEQRVALPGTELTNALNYLWKLQFFSDIRVEKEEVGKNGVTLTFHLTELPVLDTITFRGNKKFDINELKSESNLVSSKKVSEQDVMTAANKLEKLYASKGYVTARVAYQVEPTANNRVNVLFTVTEGNKVSIDKITFHGNNAFTQKKLRGILNETHQNSWWRSIFGSPKFDNEKFAADKELLLDFYRDNGYRDARILRETMSYTKDNKGLLLDIYVDEGRRYHIGTITWSGNSKDFATTEVLQKTFRIKTGDVYNAKLIGERLNFSQDNSDVSSLYLDRGYLSFRADLEEKVVHPDKVDLTISLREGELFEINTVNIKGNTKTKDHVIRRELYTVPGDMFSRKNVVRSIREISMLNYFDPEQIKPDVEPNQQNSTVDITYNVTEKQTDTFNASVGYSGVGFTGALGVTFNNFSLKDLFNSEAYRPLPHGDGQKLSLQWQFGTSNYRTLSLNFTEPWAFGTPTSVGFSAFKTHSSYDYTDDDTYNPTVIDQFGTTLSAGRRLSWPDDYFAINWKLKYLHSKGGFLRFIDFNDPNAPEEADEISITQTISRNSIDSPIYPRHGSKNSLTAQLAGGVLPGTVDFYKITGLSSWYIPVTKNLVWNISTQHGVLSTFSETDYIPYTDYFYMGGSGMSSLPTTPLRGYEDRSIGTKLGASSTTDTSLYAGKVYSKFSTELRYPLTLSQSVSVYALTFVEGGNLWQKTSEVNFADLKKSAGFGLRLYLPIIGQIGLDYGYGFDAVESEPEKTKQGWSFLFSFGNSIE
uniref:Outer membrane protein assembly factor BamA n=1 Tax=Chlorobium chlorochromatii (strain CaD3) TaxID=340177 RepID=Q3ATD9_CHLCH